MAVGTGGHGLPISSKSSDFRKFTALSENVRTFAVSIDKSFEFYRRIIELRSPTLQVPRSGATDAPENGAIMFCCYCFHLAELLLRNSFDSVSIWSGIFGATFDSMLLQCRSTATLNCI